MPPYSLSLSLSRSLFLALLLSCSLSRPSALLLKRRQGFHVAHLKTEQMSRIQAKRRQRRLEKRAACGCKNGCGERERELEKNKKSETERERERKKKERERERARERERDRERERGGPDGPLILSCPGLHLQGLLQLHELAVLLPEHQQTLLLLESRGAPVKHPEDDKR